MYAKNTIKAEGAAVGSHLVFHNCSKLQKVYIPPLPFPPLELSEPSSASYSPLATLTTSPPPLPPQLQQRARSTLDPEAPANRHFSILSAPTKTLPALNWS